MYYIYDRTTQEVIMKTTFIGILNLFSPEDFEVVITFN